MSENSQPDRHPEGDKTTDDEPILDLTEAVAASSREPGGAEEPEENLGDHFDVDQDEDDFMESLGMEIDDDEDEDAADAQAAPAPSPGADLGGFPEITPEQVDAALERVVQKMFYDRIDRILVDVIERRVKREIDRIKGILMDESGDDI